MSKSARLLAALVLASCGAPTGGSSVSEGSSSGAASSGGSGSGTGPGGTTGGTEAPTTDASSTGAGAACGDTAAPAEAIPWDQGQPEIASCAPIRGLQELRAIMHLHSHHSHDACDGDPQPGGVPDEACLADLREGLCATRIDVALTSDHPAHASDVPLVDLLLIRGDDEPILGEDKTPVASWMVCPSGHRVLVMPGIESGEMMPFGLEEHATEAYGVSSPDSFAQIKAAGGLAWVAHTEGREVAELAPLGLDGLEFYQLHANLDPEIRMMDLGLPADDYLAQVVPFFFGGSAEPDLALAAFLLPNEPSIRALEELGQTQRLTISAGTDAHQNVVKQIASDGERGDSYRRMIRWFNNRIRASERTPAAIKAALRAGNNHIVFEAFGTPVGFDFVAEGAEPAEMGAEVSLAGGPVTLRATLPRLDVRSPQGSAAPGLRALLIRAADGSRETLKTWSEGPIEVAAPGPGVYRVEVWITPRHLTPYLGDQASFAEVELPWIYSGPIYVRP